MQFYGGHNSKHYLLLNILIATNTHTSSAAGYSHSNCMSGALPLIIMYLWASVVNTVIKGSEVIEIALV